jgi:hypothetical protein
VAAASAYRMSIPHSGSDTPLLSSQLVERNTPTFASQPHGDHPVYHFHPFGTPVRRILSMSEVPCTADLGL